MRVPEQFIKRLMDFDIYSVSDKTLNQVRKYTMIDGFNFDDAKKRSAAVA